MNHQNSATTTGLHSRTPPQLIQEDRDMHPTTGIKVKALHPPHIGNKRHTMTGVDLLGVIGKTKTIETLKGEPSHGNLTENGIKGLFSSYA